MRRERAIALLAHGERALTAYDGARQAWDGFDALGTASQKMMDGARTLISGTSDDPLAIAVRRARESNQSVGGKAVFAILTGIMGIIFIPPFLKKG